jgi:hypothetical protein
MNTYEVNEQTRKRLNQLAREELKQRLLQDILFDINVCKLENWNYEDYLYELRELIEDIINENIQMKLF